MGLKALLRQFPDDAYYASSDAAMQAYGSEGLFNVVEFTSGWKVDFIIRKSRPFSVEEFERRREAHILGLTGTIASPEDVILAKLEWAKLTGSERQLRDVAGIVRMQGDNLDTVYIDRWVNDLGLQKQWADARASV